MNLSESVGRGGGGRVAGLAHLSKAFSGMQPPASERVTHDPHEENTCRSFRKQNTSRGTHVLRQIGKKIQNQTHRLSCLKVCPVVKGVMFYRKPT